MPGLSRDEFIRVVSEQRVRLENGGSDAGTNLVVPVTLRLLADQLTPVLAYRRLVSPDQRTAPSFLLESVENTDRQGRYSILGARPLVEIVSYGHITTVHDHRVSPKRSSTRRQTDPVDLIRSMSSKMKLIVPRELTDRGMVPDCVLGGWFGYASYDTVRFSEPEKLDPTRAPEDDRRLPDVHFGFYNSVVAFDHAQQAVYLVQLAIVPPDSSDECDPGKHYDRAISRLDARAAAIQRHSKPLASGRLSVHPPAKPMPSNITRDEHRAMLEKAKRYIQAGDIFQVVLGQRFERRSPADPFDVYRALRAVNPSPYMVYMQAPPALLVASSPEILCRVERVRSGDNGSDNGSDKGGDNADELRVTNRPLAGTRPRGATPAEDQRLEQELLSDPKERAEHAMLVDLGRNDVGRVARPGTVNLEAQFDIERYSHVMHISSTVTGVLREGLDCWDALRAALPVGTISGAPKIRAMQIIDELEKVRRGPYGGGIGHVALDGSMDIALALRTIVVPLSDKEGETLAPARDGTWTYHVQAAGGIVAESETDAEYDETINKAAALGRAIDVAEEAFKLATTIADDSERPADCPDTLDMPLPISGDHPESGDDGGEHDSSPGMHTG
ncbi:MAG: chorismate-binding protein [Planctomycetota bacterium]